MDIWEINKLFLFVLFAVPGIVSIKIYGLLFPGSEREGNELLIDAITYSCTNFLGFGILALVIGVPVFPISLSKAFFLLSAYLLICPWCLAVAWRLIRYHPWVLKFAPHPARSAWDFVFAQRKPSWIKVTLRDGTKIAGLYSTKSFATSASCPKEIFLQESWLLNDAHGFHRAKIKTEGILILSSEIIYLELFKNG